MFVAFSGGKDSTVLLHLARRLYSDILAVFSNTGNEYPEVVKFVKEIQRQGVNVHYLRPKMTPREVWAKYGFPLVSKEVAEKIHRVRFNPNCATSQKFLADTNRFKIPHKWRYLINEPYEVTSACCSKLKKEPFALFERATGRSAIVGTMATESRMRMTAYLRKGGCNVFHEGGGKSTPLAIWNEDDIWAYIKKYDVSIAEVYHKGATRTGCVGCGFGTTFGDDNRFSLLRTLHPKYYEMVMNYTNNGITFREALSKALSVNGLYLPDDEYNLFR